MAEILLAEDDTAVASFLRDALELDGHRATWVTDGLQAIGSLVLARFDLLLTDYHMPGATGPEVVQAIRRRREDFPVIAMSGSSVRTEFEACRVDAYLGKPVDLEELLTTVSRVLSRSRTKGDRRASPRKDIDLSVVLVTQEGSWHCRALDISQDGLQIEVPSPVSSLLAEGTPSPHACRAYLRTPDGVPTDLEVELARTSSEQDRLGLRFGPLSRSQHRAIAELLQR